MKLIVLLLGIVLVSSSLKADEPIVVSKLPEFKTATEWTDDLLSRYPSFTLVHLRETEAFWLVLFRTAENNLVWCEKWLGGLTGGATRRILDAHGKSLLLSEYDPSHDLEQPFQGRNFRTEFKIYHDNGWDVFSRDDGSLIALIQPPPRAFRIKYSFRPDGGGKVIRFDEVIDFLVD